MLTAEDECSPSLMRCRSQVARIAAVRSAVHVAGALGCSGAPSRHISTKWTSLAAAQAKPSSRRRRPPRSTPIRSRSVMDLAAAECGLALLPPGLVPFGLVLGQLEGRKTIEIHERRVRKIRDVETRQQGFLCEPCGERRQRGDVAGDLHRLIHELA